MGLSVYFRHMSVNVPLVSVDHLFILVWESTRNLLIIGNINYVENKRAWDVNQHHCPILAPHKFEFLDSSFFSQKTNKTLLFVVQII